MSKNNKTQEEIETDIVNLLINLDEKLPVLEKLGYYTNILNNTLEYKQKNLYTMERQLKQIHELINYANNNYHAYYIRNNLDDIL